MWRGEVDLKGGAMGMIFCSQVKEAFLGRLEWKDFFEAGIGVEKSFWGRIGAEKSFWGRVRAEKSFWGRIGANCNSPVLRMMLS